MIGGMSYLLYAHQFRLIHESEGSYMNHQAHKQIIRLTHDSEGSHTNQEAHTLIIRFTHESEGSHTNHQAHMRSIRFTHEQQLHRQALPTTSTTTSSGTSRDAQRRSGQGCARLMEGCWFVREADVRTVRLLICVRGWCEADVSEACEAVDLCARLMWGCWSIHYAQLRSATLRRLINTLSYDVQIRSAMF